MNLIFELLEPCEEFLALLARHARALMREIRTYVAVGEQYLPRGKSRFENGLRFETVARVEQCRKVRIDRSEWTEFPVQEFRDELAEKTAIVGKADLRKRNSPTRERKRKRIKLRTFPGAVDSLENDKFSARQH